MPVIPQKAHKPTDETRRMVESTSGLGLPHEQIAILVGIDDKTLRKYYRTELDLGKAKANGQIAKTLFGKATGGDTTALIWSLIAATVFPALRWASRHDQRSVRSWNGMNADRGLYGSIISLLPT